MSRIFSKTSEAIVCIAEQNSPLRSCIAEALRRNGIENISTFSNLTDVFEHLETETVDWVITASFSNDPINFIHLLQMFTQNVHFRKSNVSLMMGPADMEFLPLAFENGLLSYHNKNLPAMIPNEFADLFQVSKENRGNTTFTSAHYLRRLLSGDRHYRSLIQLERTLLEMYPVNINLLINLGQSLLMEGSLEEGKRALLQAKAIAPSVQDKVMDMISQYADESIEDFFDSEIQKPKDDNAIMNILGIENVVIIDPDTAVQYTVTNVLTELGVPQITCFNDGDKFWSWFIDGGKPDMILMEWKFTGLSGAMLIQRLRQQGFHSPPILVVSSQISPGDKPLLMEMGVNNSLPKPFEAPELLTLLVTAVQQNKAPSEQHSLYSKIRQLLETSRLEEAAKLIAAFIENPDFDSVSKLEIRARFEYAIQNFTAAKDLAYEAIKNSRDPLDLLNFLGKVLMVLKEYETALKCFSKAQAMSPKNIERLSYIANIQIETGNIDQAETTLISMKTLDSGNELVAETDAKIGLATADQVRVQTAFEKIDSLRNIIAYLNNKAVTLIKCEKYEEGITLYQTALDSLPKNESQFIVTVSYNMALAQIKYSELDKALELLTKLQLVDGTPINKRIKTLIKRIEKSITENVPLILTSEKKTAEETLPTEGTAENDNPPAKSDPTRKVAAADKGQTPEKKSLQGFMEGLQPNRGDICCYRIYKANELLTPESIRLTQKPPEFRRREGIKRADTLKSKPGVA